MKKNKLILGISCAVVVNVFCLSQAFADTCQGTPITSAHMADGYIVCDMPASGLCINDVEGKFNYYLQSGSYSFQCTRVSHADFTGCVASVTCTPPSSKKH